METRRRRGWRGRLAPKPLLLCCFFAMCLISGSGMGSAYSVEQRSISVARVHDSGVLEEVRSSRPESHTQGSSGEPAAEAELVRRRNLSGPGSYPPRCTAKCGKCTPCRAVRVTVPPGTPVTAEYYPEAWRCKCGNRLYMP